MKIYTTRAAKWLALIAVISIVILAAGIFCISINTSCAELQVVLTVFGSLMTILFLPCLLAERGRRLIIDEDKIVLPRGADINGICSFNRTIISANEIRSTWSELYKGDGIVGKDTLFHTLELTDETRIKFTLYAYGRDAEGEIIEMIKKYIERIPI